jgi:hypothetical protein
MGEKGPVVMKMLSAGCLPTLSLVEMDATAVATHSDSDAERERMMGSACVGREWAILKQVGKENSTPT